MSVALDVADGDADGDADADAVADADGDGEAVWLGSVLALADGEDTVGGSLATSELVAEGLAEDEGDGEGDEGSDGDGVGVADEGRA